MTHFYIYIFIIVAIILISFFTSQPETKAEIPQQVKNLAEPILLAKNIPPQEQKKVVVEKKSALIDPKELEIRKQAWVSCYEAEYCGQ